MRLLLVREGEEERREVRRAVEAREPRAQSGEGLDDVEPADDAELGRAAPRVDPRVPEDERVDAAAERALQPLRALGDPVDPALVAREEVQDLARLAEVEGPERERLGGPRRRQVRAP